MKRYLSLVVAALTFMWGAIAGAQEQATWRGKSVDDFYRYLGPDLDFQGGLGHRWDVGTPLRDDTAGFGRMRFGALWVPTWPWALTLGGTVEVNNLPVGIGGVQAEALHLGSGLWIRAGAGMDPFARPHMNAAAGWSIFGLEVSGFPRNSVVTNGQDPREAVSLFATIRIPLGYVFYVFAKH